MNIKIADESDRESVISLVNELQRHGGNELIKTKTQQYEKILQSPEHRMFLIFEGPKPVGLATFYSYPKLAGQRAVIEDFIVTEAERGKGYGSKLLEHIKQYCKNTGIEVLNIASRNDNEKAHRFYLRNGGSFNTKLFKFSL